MRQSLLGLAAFVALPLATPALAAGDARHQDWCGFRDRGLPHGRHRGPYRYRGVLYAAIAVHSSSGPVTATVECEMYSYTGHIGAFTASGTGLVAGATSLDFVLGPLDSITICTRVDYADDSPDEDVCVQPDLLPIPPSGFAGPGAGGRVR